MQTAYYGILFLPALAILARMKRRHDAASRLNRGLNLYLSARNDPESQA